MECVRSIIPIALLLAAGPLAGQNAPASPPSTHEHERQEMLRTYLSTRVMNGRPAVPALVILCPAVTGIPLDSAYKARLKSLMVMDEVMTGDCSAIGRDADSLSRRNGRQIVAITGFEVTAQEATFSVRVFRVGGMHEEVAHFKHDLGWVLDALTLKRFWEI